MTDTYYAFTARWIARGLTPTQAHNLWAQTIQRGQPEHKSDGMSAPPAYLALDLWMALELPIEEFDAYYERNHWADTWANLLAAVRERTGRKVCWKPVGQGERCVLTQGHFGPCYGDSDVGSSEPLPFKTNPGRRRNPGRSEAT